MIYTKNQTTVVGLDELIKAFNKLPDEALQYVRDGSIDAGNKILERAKQLVPVDTGVTKTKLYLKKPSNSKKKVKYKVLATIGAKKGAAAIGPLELGHKLVFFGRPTGVTVEPRPFLRPAADENKEYTITTIAASMDKAIENMGGLK